MGERQYKYAGYDNTVYFASFVSATTGSGAYTANVIVDTVASSSVINICSAGSTYNKCLAFDRITCAHNGISTP